MRIALAAIFLPALSWLASAAPVASIGASAADAVDAPFRLIMVEQAGCGYCAQWYAEIGPIYPKSPEGKLAPLEHVDLRSDWAEGLQIGAAPVFTPTFVLMQNDAEVGRIEGYPGEDFFWGLLGMALRDAGADLPPPQ
ncbi:thioredoxin family protein [Sinirhodobacter sp. HNIBRBA609]|nr:thioredoxin family protein [Sinirhodobacter sp. HNIBRBA609]